MTAAIFISAGIIIFVYGIIFITSRHYTFQTGSKVIAMFTLLSVFIMSVPSNITALSSIDSRPLRTLFGVAKGFLAGIKAAYGATDPTFIIPADAGYPAPLYAFFFVCILIIALAAPIISAALVLSLFNNVSDAIRYMFSRFRTQRIFTSMNPQTIKLAIKIHNDYPHDTILFCNTDSDFNPTLREKAHAAAAISVSKNELEISASGEMHFYCFSDDPSSDINSAMQLIDKYGQRSRTWINLFTDVSRNRTLLDSISQDNTLANIMVIDSVQITSYNLLDRYPLYNAIDKNELNVMLLGLGYLGTELLKAVIECGQITGVSLHIWCIDINADSIQKQLENSYPELTGNHGSTPGNYNIDYVSLGIDSTDFPAFLDSLSVRPGWAAITTDNDNLNAATAIRLYSRYSSFPGFHVLARVNNSIMIRQFQNTLRRGGEDMLKAISFFGNESSYDACRFLYSSELSRMALNVDLCYGMVLDHDMYVKSGSSEDERTSRIREISRFYHSYRESSSLASALGIRYKLYQAGVLLPTLADGSAAPLGKEQAEMFSSALSKDPDLLLKLTINEHDRWMAYTRADGYRRCDIDEIRHNYEVNPEWKGKNLIIKSHPFLVPWNSLDPLDQEILAISGKDPASKAKDEIIVDNISSIIRLDYRMEVKELE